jgi:SAM-dependent methyltransferase
MLAERGPRGEAFARQILATTRPFLLAPPEALTVLDIGCGYGATAVALARSCRRVVAIEPNLELVAWAQRAAAAAGTPNATFSPLSVYDLDEEAAYDLAVLDNVLEHLPDQPRALAIVTRALRPGGVLYCVVPNKLWPFEAHYGLPGLSYLPLPLANAYLRLTGRGHDYSDASYAPTIWRLRRLLADRPELDARFVLPADLALTTRGPVWSYRLGVALLRRWPALWAISKAFVVVGVKRGL